MPGLPSPESCLRLGFRRSASPVSLTPLYNAVSSSDHRLAPAFQALSDAIWPFPRTGPTDTSPEQNREAHPPLSPPSPGSPSPAPAGFFHVENSCLQRRREQAASGHKQSSGSWPGRAEGLGEAIPFCHSSFGHEPLLGLGHRHTLYPTPSTPRHVVSLVHAQDLVAAYILKKERGGDTGTLEARWAVPILSRSRLLFLWKVPLLYFKSLQGHPPHPRWRPASW